MTTHTNIDRVIAAHTQKVEALQARQQKFDGPAIKAAIDYLNAQISALLARRIKLAGQSK